jgi:hypothetical protein
LYDAEPKSLAAKDGTKTILIVTTFVDVTRFVATNDQSKIHYFKKQTVEKLTSQARSTNDLHRVLLWH